MGKLHPVAWYHNYDGGRAFYTALGHIPASFSDPVFLNHLYAGIFGQQQAKNNNQMSGVMLPAEFRRACPENREHYVIKLSANFSSNFVIVIASIPAAPLLARTLLYASHTIRLVTGTDFVSIISILLLFCNSCKNNFN